MNDDGKVAAVGGEKDIFLTNNGKWFSRSAIFSKPVGGAIQAFRAIVRWLRRRRVITKGYIQRDVGSGVMARQEFDSFIRSALQRLPQRAPSSEDARAVLIAEGIITADGELAAEYRPAGDGGKLEGLAVAPSSRPAGRGRGGIVTAAASRRHVPHRIARQKPPRLPA
jgi:hypothetical protein